MINRLFYEQLTTVFWFVHFFIKNMRGRRGRGRMVIGFTTTYAISA